MRDHARAAQQVAADDGTGDVAHDLDDVVAKTADYGGDDLRAGAQDEDRVIALEGIELGALDIRELHVQARAEDAFPGDHEAVVERCAQHHDLVEARAAVEADRRVDGIVDRVGAVAAVDLGVALHGQVQRHERAHRELIVARFALEPQGAGVVVDVEGVCAAAAESGGSVGDARADVGDAVERTPERPLVVDRRIDRIQGALRQDAGHRIERGRIKDDGARNRIPDQADDHRRGGELVDRRKPGGRIARRAEHLADLERVVAVAAVERGDGAVVVDDELVVAAEAVDGQAGIDALVVVDALDLGEARSRYKAVEQHDEITPQQKGVVRLVGEAGDHIGAVDGQRVDAVVRSTVVVHVDQGVALAGEVHRVLVRIAFAVQVQHRGQPVHMGAVEQRVEKIVVRRCGGELEARVEARIVRGRVDADMEDVVAALPVDRGDAADAPDGDGVVAPVHGSVAVAREHIGGAGMGTIDVKTVCAGSQPQVEVFDAGVIHAGRHLEPAQRAKCQRAGLVGRIRGVVDIDSVGLAAAVDDDQAVDRVDHAGSGGDRRRQRRRIRDRQCWRQVAQVEGVGTFLAVYAHFAAEACAAHVDRVSALLTVHRQQPAGIVDVDRIGSLRGIDGRFGRVRAVDVEQVVAEPEPDIQLLESNVVDPDIELQATQRGRGQRADFVVRCDGRRVVHVHDIQPVAAAVDLEQRVDRVDAAGRSGSRPARQHRRQIRDVHRVAIGAAMDIDGAVHAANVEHVVAGVAVEGRHTAASRTVDVDRIGVRLAIHHEHVGHAIDVHGVGARAGVERRVLKRRGRRPVRAIDGERVAAAAQGDDQVLDGAVGDAPAHTQSGDGRGGQRAGIWARVATVVHVEPVAATRRSVAVDRQHVTDVVADAVDVPVGVDVRARDGARRIAADVERFVAGSAVDRRRPADRPHVDDVVAVVAVQVGDPGMRAVNCEGVADRAQADVQGLERAVGDAAGHIEAADRRRGQSTGVGVVVTGIINVQDVGFAIAVDGQQGADAVYRAPRIVAHIDNGSRGIAAHVDGIRASAGVDRGGAANGARVDDVVVFFGVHRQQAADDVYVEVDDVLPCGRVDRGTAAMGTGNVEDVVTRGKPDEQGLERAVVYPLLERKASQGRRGQRAGFVVHGRIGIVHFQNVAAIAAVNDQQAVDGIDRSHRIGRNARQGRRCAAHVDDVVAFAAIDDNRTVRVADVEDVVAAQAVQREGAARARAVNVERVAIRLAVHDEDVGHIVDMQHVGAAAGVDGGRFLEADRGTTVGTVDRKRVAAVAQQDDQVLDGAIGDAARHVETGNRRGGQRSGVRAGVGAVVHVEPVAAACRVVAVDGQQGTDAVDALGGAADIEGVGTAAAIDRRRTADGPDVDGVGAVVGIEVRHARVRALDRERVPVRAEVYIQRRDGVVADVASHIQTADRRARQRAGIDAAIGDIARVERVGPALAEYMEVGPYSIQGAIADIDRIVTFAGVDRGLGIDGLDVDDIRARVGPDRRFRTAGDVADCHSVVFVLPVHEHVIRVYRAEQIDDRARQVNGAVVAAHNDVSRRGNYRAGLQVEVAPCKQFDITACR